MQVDAAISAALNCQGGPELAAAAAAAAVQLVLQQENSSMSSEVDEFGRDMNLGQRLERQQVHHPLKGWVLSTLL